MGQPEQSEAASRLPQPALFAGDIIDLLELELFIVCNSFENFTLIIKIENLRRMPPATLVVNY